MTKIIACLWVKPWHGRQWWWLEEIGGALCNFHCTICGCQLKLPLTGWTQSLHPTKPTCHTRKLETSSTGSGCRAESDGSLLRLMGSLTFCHNYLGDQTQTLCSRWRSTGGGRVQEGFFFSSLKSRAYGAQNQGKNTRGRQTSYRNS